MLFSSSLDSRNAKCHHDRLYAVSKHVSTQPSLRALWVVCECSGEGRCHNNSIIQFSLWYLTKKNHTQFKLYLDLLIRVSPFISVWCVRCRWTVMCYSAAVFRECCLKELISNGGLDTYGVGLKERGGLASYSPSAAPGCVMKEQGLNHRSVLAFRSCVST